LFPFVSIVIPMLNEEKYIGQCLESILKQDYPKENIEIVVVDGGSTDNSVDIVYNYIQKYPNIKFLYNPRSIPPSAMNQGIKFSKGDYIIRIDAHCEYPEDYIRKCVEKSQMTGAMNVGGLFISSPASKRFNSKIVYLVESNKFGGGGAKFRFGNKPGNVDTVAFGCFKREVFDKVGFMDERLPRNHDYEFNTRIIEKRGCVYFDPDIRFRYFCRPTLLKHLKKIWRDGFEHFEVFRINTSAIRIRHWIPATFVTSLIISFLLGLIYSFFLSVFIFIIGIYLIASLIASIEIGNKYGWKYSCVLPLIFFLIHMTYGLAALTGVFRFGIFGIPPPLDVSDPIIHPIIRHKI